MLADPTRRAVLERLVHDGPQTATDLAEHFPTTRQAIVKHLRVLADAGLVAPERDGREVRYVATTERLADAVTWLLDTEPQLGPPARPSPRPSLNARWSPAATDASALACAPAPKTV